MIYPLEVVNRCFINNKEKGLERYSREKELPRRAKLVIFRLALLLFPLFLSVGEAEQPTNHEVPPFLSTEASSPSVQTLKDPEIKLASVSFPQSTVHQLSVEAVGTTTAVGPSKDSSQHSGILMLALGLALFIWVIRRSSSDF